MKEDGIWPSNWSLHTGHHHQVNAWIIWISPTAARLQYNEEQDKELDIGVLKLQAAI